MLELPAHHATLLALHAAVEHALVVHLATAGTAGSAIEEEEPAAAAAAAAATATATASAPGLAPPANTVPTLRVPGLIMYSALRPLVERSCGRRFGRDELARLAWLWGVDAAAGREGRTNIGFEITRCSTSASGAGSVISSSASMQRNLGAIGDGHRRGASDYMLGLRMKMDAAEDEDDDDDDNNDDDDDGKCIDRARHIDDDSGAEGDRAVKLKAECTASRAPAPLAARNPPRTPPMKQRVIRTPGSRNDPASPSPSPRIVQSPFLGRTLPSSSNPSPTQTIMPKTPTSVQAKLNSSPRSIQRCQFEQSGGSVQAFLDANSEAALEQQDPSVAMYARRGISLVSLWNNGMARRKREVRKRLVAWCRGEGRRDITPVTPSVRSGHLGLAISVNHDAAHQPATPKKRQYAVEGAGGLMTPTSSREEGHVPGSKRIKMDPDMLLPPADVRIPQRHTFSLADGNGDDNDQRLPSAEPSLAIASIPMAELPGSSSSTASSTTTTSFISSPSPSKPTRVEAARAAHRTAIAQTEARLGRKLSLTERIRAKEDAANVGSRPSGGSSSSSSSGGGGGGSVTGTGMRGSTSAQSVAASARQRAALSRLQYVAESVYMLFVSSGSTGNASGSSLGGSHWEEDADAVASPFLTTTTGAAARKAASLTRASPSTTPLPLSDVVRAICQSSKVAMGASEARDALDRLSCIAPGFIEVVPVGARHWVRLHGQVRISETSEGNAGYSDLGADEPMTGATVLLPTNAYPGSNSNSSSSSSVLGAVRRCIRAEMGRMGGVP